MCRQTGKPGAIRGCLAAVSERRGRPILEAIVAKSTARRGEKARFTKLGERQKTHQYRSRQSSAGYRLRGRSKVCAKSESANPTSGFGVTRPRCAQRFGLPIVFVAICAVAPAASRFYLNAEVDLKDPLLPCSWPPIRWFRLIDAVTFPSLACWCVVVAGAGGPRGGPPRPRTSNPRATGIGSLAYQRSHVAVAGRRLWLCSILN